MGFRMEMLENERFAKMILRDHLEESLSEGFVYATTLDHTTRLSKKNLPEILSLFELTHFPNYLFLISVEGCCFAKSTVASFDVFHIKHPTERAIRKVLEEENYEYIAYNISNTDQIIVLLYCEPSGGPEKTRDKLKKLGKKMADFVRKEAQEEIAVVISNCCEKTTDFPAAYNACREDFTMLFTDAAQAVRIVGEKKKDKETPIREQIIEQYQSVLVGAVNAFDAQKLSKAIDVILKDMLQKGFSGNRIKLHTVNLISFLTGYYGDFLKDWTQIEEAGITASHIILNANLVSTIKKALYELAQRLTDGLTSSYRIREIKISKQLDAIFENNYKNSSLTIGDVAKEMGYNNSYFGKLFQKIHHTSFKNYLSEYRILRSKVLLSESDLPIRSVAESVGFGDHTYYCTVFKRLTGHTPQQYRNEQKLSRTDSV